MTNDEALALVVGLALTVEDRTTSEQRALERVATQVDRRWNRQTTSNRRLDARTWPGPPCTYSDDHDKKACACKGAGFAYEPRGGWSRLAQQI